MISARRGGLTIAVTARSDGEERGGSASGHDVEFLSVRVQRLRLSSAGSSVAMRETKPKLLGGGGQHALAVDEHRRHLAERRAQHECRRVKHRRADAARAPSVRVNVRLVTGVRRRGVEGAGGAIVLRPATPPSRSSRRRESTA